MQRRPAVIITGIAFLLAVSCTAQQKQDVKSGLDTAKPFLDAACLLANLAKPDEEALKYCKVLDPAIEAGRSFLVTSRGSIDQQAAAMATRAALATPCASVTAPAVLLDAGSPDAGRRDGGR